MLLEEPTEFFGHADTVAHKLLNREDRETLHWLVNWLDYAPVRIVSPSFLGKPPFTVLRWGM